MSEFDNETETQSLADAEAASANETEEKSELSGETIFCAVSKQMVPLEETVEVERKKGEILRIHQRFKKF